MWILSTLEFKWSNINAGSKYQLSGNQGDRYLVSGKETDNLSGNILLDWRDYDSVTGRMNSFDPEDQSMSMSGYAYCGNNPVMRVDPDGRFAFVPFLVGALVSGHIGGVISGIAGGSYEKGFVTGFLSGAAGYFAPIGFLPGMAYGAGTGAAIGGINAAMNGGNIWKGALTGAIIGGVTGGISGGIGALQKGGNFWTGYREPHILELSALPSGKEVPFTDETLNNAVNKFNSVRPKELSGVYRTEKWVPKGWKVENNTLVSNVKGKFTQAVAVTVPRIWVGGNSFNISISQTGFRSQEFLNATLVHEFGHVVINSNPTLYKASQESSGLGNQYIDNMGHASIYKMQYEFAQLNHYDTYIQNTFSSYFKEIYYPIPFQTNIDLDQAIKHLIIKIK